LIIAAAARQKYTIYLEECKKMEELKEGHEKKSYSVNKVNFKVNNFWWPMQFSA